MCLMLAVCLLLSACRTQGPSPAAGTRSSGSLATLEGTVAQVSEGMLTLAAGEAHYSFRLEEDILHTPEGGIQPGCPARVSYYGALTGNQIPEPVDVVRMVVLPLPEEGGQYMEDTPGATAHAFTEESGSAESPAPPNGDTASTGQASESGDPAGQILQSMTLEEKVGQMILARCPQSGAPEAAAAYHLGGYLLFARDFEGKTPLEVSAEIQSIQSSVSIPLLIGVDEEGGEVNRISRFPAFRDRPFPSPQELYRQGGWEAIRSDTVEKSALLRSLGINLNMAPVCDISTDPIDYIYPRTLGQDAAATSQYVELVVSEMRAQQMGCVLKHFPGYGGNADTHAGLSTDARSLSTLEGSDLLPFQSGIEAGAGAVLVSHNIVACMDPDAPASLSPAVHQYLRDQLGFEGVILTDALDMGAITSYTDARSAVVQAVLAGNDLLCCTDYEAAISALLEALDQGMIAEESIDQSVLRILRWKLELGVIL